ncbi:MAG: hypothetical protein IKS71_05730 [Bacteroidales bacterium]|nr:hypothetical protein [Bacteroidales bacterium]
MSLRISLISLFLCFDLLSYGAKNPLFGADLIRNHSSGVRTAIFGAKTVRIHPIGAIIARKSAEMTIPNHSGAKTSDFDAEISYTF